MKRALAFFVLYVIFLLSTAFIFRALEAREIVLEKDNTVFLDGPVDQQFFDDFNQQFQTAINNSSRINIIINTYGGSVPIVLSIVKTIEKYSHTHKINIIAVKAISSGYMIHQLSNVPRLAVGKASLMWHQLRFINISGTSTQLIPMLLKSLEEEIELNKILHSKTKLDEKTFMINREVGKTYTAEEALTAGIVDEIITIKCEKKFIKCDTFVALNQGLL